MAVQEEGSRSVGHGVQNTTVLLAKSASAFRAVYVVISQYMGLIWYKPAPRSRVRGRSSLMVLVSSFERRARFASVGHEKQSKRRNLEPAASTVGVVSWFGVNKRGKPRAVIVFSHRKCLSTRFAKVNSLIDSLIYPLLLLIQMFVREVTFAKRLPLCKLIHRGKLATAR